MIPYVDYTEVPDSLPDTSGADKNLFNDLTGFLGKAADTALDLYTTNAKAKIASTYPTGQQNPAAAASSNTQPAFNWKPWAIGGGVAVGAIVLLVVLTRK